MKEIKVRNKRQKISVVKKLFKSAGNALIGIHFVKRSDGSNRRMTCRLRVRKPMYASVPSGKKTRSNSKEHGLITVFDTNSMRYNNKHRICGRGAWKSIPLDGVNRIRVNGEIYKIIG